MVLLTPGKLLPPEKIEAIPVLRETAGRLPDLGYVSPT